MESERYRYHKQRGGCVTNSFIAWVILSFTGITASAQINESEVQLKLTSGKSLKVQLENVDSTTVVAQVDGESRQFNLDDVSQILMSVDGPQLAATRFEVCLRDDSRLLAAEIKIVDKTLTARLSTGTTFEIRPKMVRWIKLKDYRHDLTLTHQWNEILDNETRSSDTIVVNRDGELDSVEGMLGDLVDDKISFSIGDRSANISLEKVDAMVFYQPTGQQLPEPLCQAQLIDGSRLNLQRFVFSDPTLEGTTSTGVKVILTRADLRSLEFEMGHDVYLDELAPTSSDWRPLIANSATLELLRPLNLPRTNRSFTGKRISLNVIGEAAVAGDESDLAERQFEHGIAIRGGSKMAFALNGKYATLTGLAGFDPQSNYNGDVLLTIRADGEKIWEEPMIKREMKAPLPIDLNIDGVRRLLIQVDYHDRRSVGDQIHLVDLKVSK